jgi:hypothetical protein
MLPRFIQFLSNVQADAQVHCGRGLCDFIVSSMSLSLVSEKDSYIVYCYIKPTSLDIIAEM